MTAKTKQTVLLVSLWTSVIVVPNVFGLTVSFVSNYGMTLWRMYFNWNSKRKQIYDRMLINCSKLNINGALPSDVFVAIFDYLKKKKIERKIAGFI